MHYIWGQRVGVTEWVTEALLFIGTDHSLKEQFLETTRVSQ